MALLGEYSSLRVFNADLYTACFLMKEALHESQRLDEAMKMLQWYAITNDVFPKPIGNGINIDVLNTQITGRLASILIMNDTPEKVQYLKSFSRWMDYACRPSNGLSGGFKVDGSAFHHCNNYPAYATGGLTGATDMIYLLSRTGFAVSELAHQSVKKCFLPCVSTVTNAAFRSLCPDAIRTGKEN